MEEFEVNNERMRKIATKALIWSGYLMPLTNVINNLSYVGISIVSGILAVEGAISIGHDFQLSSLCASVFAPVCRHCEHL